MIVRTLLRAAGLLLGLVVLMQVITVERDNPPITGTIVTPPAVTSVLRRSCFDCHSNETVWPWYSRVAPVSWLVAHDVHEGREHLNFSEWRPLARETKQRRLGDIIEVLREGEMPPGIYTPLHPEARLSMEEVAALQNWATTALAAELDEVAVPAAPGVPPSH